MVLSKLLVALAMGSTLPVAAQVETVFGLPLGGKLTQLPKQCPSKIEQRTPLCWADNPTRTKGATIGTAFIPEGSTPAWAQLPRIEISKEGVVERLTFTVATSAQTESYDSISKRFGAPTQAGTTNTGSAWSEWDTPRLYIRRICPKTQACTVQFLSRSAANAASKRTEDARHARPSTP